jgi:hypothetical protein
MAETLPKSKNKNQRKEMPTTNAKLLAVGASATLCLALIIALAATGWSAEPNGDAKSDNKLVGTWKMGSGDVMTIKHVTPTQFMWATIDKDGTVTRAAGGPYTLKGDAYEETPEYGIGSDFELIKGKPQTFKWKVEGNKWYHTGKLSNGYVIDEVWERVEKSVPVTSAAVGVEAPKGWFAAGDNPNDYVMSLDRKVSHSGNSSASLKSIVSKAHGFGTLMQTVKADPFRARRIRFSGYVRGNEVMDWAGLWLRVDGSNGGEMLAFDNMQDRPIKGTTDWQKYEIVLDVPEQSQAIAFGLLLAGLGQVWMDDLTFEVVGNDVATTAKRPTTTRQRPTERLPKAPTNLDFEQ